MHAEDFSAIYSAESNKGICELENWEMLMIWAKFDCDFLAYIRNQRFYLFFFLFARLTAQLVIALKIFISEKALHSNIISIETLFQKKNLTSFSYFIALIMMSLKVRNTCSWFLQVYVQVNKQVALIPTILSICSLNNVDCNHRKIIAAIYWEGQLVSSAATKDLTIVFIPPWSFRQRAPQGIIDHLNSTRKQDWKQY